MKGGLQSSCYFFTFLYDSESKRDARKAYEICTMGEGTETSFFHAFPCGKHSASLKFETCHMPKNAKKIVAFLQARDKRITKCPLSFQVFCACAIAYIMSLSLALSLTALASRHHHLHLRTTNGLAASCLPTESACHFHQKVVIKVPPPLQENAFTRGSCGFCNNSQTLTQGRSSPGERSPKQGVNRPFGEDQSRFTSENFRSVIDSYSYRMPIMPNGTALTVEIVPRLSKDKAHRVFPNLSCSPSHFLSNMYSLKVLLQSAKLSTSIAKNSNLNLKMTVAEGDSVFSEILQRRRKIYNHLSSNQSSVCVA